MATSAEAQPTYYTISVEELAKWLDGHEDTMWSADTEPALDRLVDYFPCLGPDFADALRQLQRDTIHLFVNNRPASRAGEAVDRTRLDEIADRDNRYEAREFLCRWPEGGEGWVLAEEVPATEQWRAEREAERAHAAS